MKLAYKVLLYLLILTCNCTLDLMAQSRNLQSMMPRGMSGNGGGNSRSNSRTQAKDSLTEDPCIPLKDGRYCWHIDPLTGLKNLSVPDTTFIGLGNRQSMENKALAIVHTGNLFSPHQVQAYFDRRENHDFLFLNAYNLFRIDPSQQLYYNTKIPCTLISYSKEGGGLQTNDHFKLNFFGNFNKEFGLGSRVDYVYARGEYMNSSTKPLNWNSYLYYEGDKYKAYANYTLSKYANQENGGITDRDLVLRPDNYSKNFTDPKNLATNLARTWNDNDLRQVHFQHNYNLGKWVERINTKDSTLSEEFVPIASIFQSIDYEFVHHNYIMESGAQQVSDRKFFHNKPNYDDSQTHDSTTYRNFSTYVGLRMNEGFNKFAQFSLSGFIGYERQTYTLLQDTTLNEFVPHRHHYSNNIWLGAQMSRQLSSIITFEGTARTAIITGDKKGDFELSGKAKSVLPIGETDPTSGLRTDSVIIEANAFVKKTHVPYLMEHYFSNYFKWDNKFEAEYRTRIEGRLSYPRTKTSARIGVEHIDNFHYFGADSLPHQASEKVDIFAVEVRQSLWAGKWLQWDNAILFQTATPETILSLPDISIESDLSLHFRIAKTLSIQAGVAAYYYSRYYAPNYQPATQQFCNQHDIKCGNYPKLNGYVNCNLKRIKFFLTVHNMLDKAITNDMFLMPYYPSQTRRIEYGIILDLQN